MSKFSDILDRLSGVKSNKTVEALMTVYIDDVPVTMTGESIVKLDKDHRKGAVNFLVFNVNSGTGHYFCKTLREVARILGTRIEQVKDSLEVGSTLDGYRIITMEQFQPAIHSLMSNKDFVQAVRVARQEVIIRRAGDIARANSILNSLSGRRSFSNNVDPNISAFRAEQAYRRMFRQ